MDGQLSESQLELSRQLEQRCNPKLIDRRRYILRADTTGISQHRHERPDQVDRIHQHSTSVYAQFERKPGPFRTNQHYGVDAIGGAAGPAEIEFNTPVINASSSALITGHNTLLRFHSGLTNQAAVAFSTGTSDVFGDINNAAGGNVTISGGASVTFYDDIMQNGTFRVSKVGSTTSAAAVFGTFSGTGGTTGGGDIFFEGDLQLGNSPASITFANNVSLGSTSRLTAEIGGMMAGTQFDQVKVQGQLTLSGALDISLVNSFVPIAGQSFQIVTATGGISGAFDAASFPFLPGGLALNLAYTPTAVTLSVVAGLPGDFNQNRIVDAIDYVVWRNSLGTVYTQTDYEAWRTHFGQNGSIGALAGASVPEPLTYKLLPFAVGPLVRRSRFRTNPFSK